MDNKQRILKEAGELFSRYGIRSVTMDYISAELGISKRTLYEIFKDKDDLVSQTISEAARMHKEFCFKTVEESENVIEAIFKIGKLNNEVFGKMNPLFFEDLKKFHPVVFDKIHQKGEIRDYKLTLKLFERGVAEGVISDLLNIELVNIFVHKILDIIHSDDMKVFRSSDILNTAFLPYFYGIATTKGRKLIDNYLKTF